MSRDEEQLYLIIEEAVTIQIVNEDGEDVSESRRERSDDAS